MTGSPSRRFHALGPRSRFMPFSPNLKMLKVKHIICLKLCIGRKSNKLRGNNKLTAS